jgi:signal transduction histidine kinase
VIKLSLRFRLFALAIGATPGAVEDANIIEREISRLEYIVRDVLSFARHAEPKRQLGSAMTLLHEVRRAMSWPAATK